MDAFFNWLINAPVWIQTPLVLAVVIPLCALVAWGVVRVFRVVIPLGEDERRYAVVDGARWGADSAGGEGKKKRGGDGSQGVGDDAGTPHGGETWHSDDAADRL